MREFRPGFRLSILDAFIILIAITAAWLGRELSAQGSFIILFVVGHFFLFCNVLRMSRTPELIWASSFLVLAGGALWFEHPSWLLVVLVSLLITLLLSLVELRKPGYHGLYWQQLNPKLPLWFEHFQKDSRKGSNNDHPNGC